MNTISQNFRLVWNALWLQRDAYETLRDDNNPFVEGLFILVLLGLLVGLVGLVGALLEWASLPNPAVMQETILENLKQMPWWDQMAQAGGSEVLDVWQQVWDSVWAVVGSVMPSPVSGLAGLVLAPIGLIVNWLVFGVVAYLLARLFGGVGTLNQTLGTTALAAAPQLLVAVAGLPFVVAAGVGTWTLLCRYMALRTTHDLSWPRAVGAAVLPPIILGILLGILITAGLAVFGATLAAIIEGGL
jgi:hypothetical protein